MKPIEIIRFVATLCLIFLSASCNKLSLNGNNTPNDAAPSAPILASGQLIGLNGKTVSGAVIVYNPYGGSNILRLSGVTLPNELGLEIIANVNNADLPAIPVRFTTGSQNYTLNVSGSTFWTLVTIRSTLNDLDYAQAIMQMSGQ